MTVREFASKASEHACRIAAVMALVQKADATVIDIETMRSALRLVQAYLDEHIRLTGAAGVSVEINHAVKLLDWLKRTKRKEVSSRDVMRRGPNSIREAPAAKAALKTLAEYGWLVSDDGRRYFVPSVVTDEWS